MRRVREVRWLLVGQTLVAFVALVVVVPRLVDCVTVEVASSSGMGKVAALQDIARDYNRADHRVGDRCVEVSVHGTSSGVAMAALRDGWSTGDGVDAPEPQVWMPASTMWLELLRVSGRVPGLPDPDDVASVTSNNLVMAVPRPMAEALGWPGRRFTWEQLAELERDGWPDGHTDRWGPFTFVKGDVLHSTSGLGATVAAYQAGAVVSAPPPEAAATATVTATATADDGPQQQTQQRQRRRQDALQVADVDDPDVTAFVRSVEAGVHYYVDDTVGFLQSLAAHDAGDPDFHDPFVSAVVVEEQMVLEYNAGAYDGTGDQAPPHTPLVALYPVDGLLALDHPYVVLPSGSDAQQQAADDFLRHLRQPGPQRELTGRGFRGLDGRLDTLPGAEEAGLQATVEGPRPVLPPSGEVLQRMLDSYDDVRKPARVLLLVDGSGSMGETLDGDGRSRFEVVENSLDRGLGHLSDEDEIGLWTFPGPDGASRQVLVPLAPFEADQRRRIVDGVVDLAGTGDGRRTPLYRAIRAAYDHLQRNGSTGAVNAVVVLTDEEDDDRSERAPSLEQLVAQVDAEVTGPDRRPPVRVFSIGMPGASYPALDAISDSTNAEAFAADDPAGLAAAFVAAFSRL